MNSNQFSPWQHGPKAVAEFSPSPSSETRVQLPSSYNGSDAFLKLLSDSISEALTDLLGTRTREAVFDYMERNYSIARNEIPEHLDQFFTLFERNLGAKTKTVIGRTIARKAYSKLDWEFEPIPNFEFADYLETMKTRLAKVVRSA